MESQPVERLRQQPTPEHDPLDVSNPLQGVVLCCTSIPPEKRTELASQAEQMGAQHKYDLTSDVTHLIVGEYDTPKYRYVAKERPDVKVLRPEWIEEIRRLWIEDQRIELNDLERKFTLPTFETLQICVTGFDDIAERQRMMELIEGNGGKYHGDLTKKVTHLVVHRPEGAKYKHAKNWGLYLVSVEWLHDSLERGMILDERLYDPESPPEERGKGAWIRRALSPSLGKRSRDGSIASLEEGRRKLRRTASSKLTSQSEKIWGDIVGGSSTTQRADSSDVGQSKEDDGPQNVSTEAPTQDIESKSSIVLAKGGTFENCLFYIDGFDRRKTQVLSQHLLSHDGTILENLEELSQNSSSRRYVVRPHTVALPNPFIYPDEVQIVTDFWVERCLEAKFCMDRETYPLGLPFPYVPTPGFEKLSVCSTSFEGMQLRHIYKAVALVGAKYEENFTKDASVLICDPKRPLRAAKLACAKSWKVPIVTIDWLTDSIQNGQRQPFKQYLLRQKTPKPEEIIVLDKEESHELHAPDIKEDRHQEKEAALKLESQSSKHHLKPPKASGFDTTAFDEVPTEIKREDSPLPATARPSSTTMTTTTNEPLNEISSNSQRNNTKSKSKSKSTSPSKQRTESEHLVSSPPGPPPEDLTSAISSLLARSRPGSTVPPAASNQNLSNPSNGTNPNTNSNGNPAEDTRSSRRKKRTQTRILGRAASNVSATGSSLSRASSVDSTASRGQAVIWPSDAKKGSAGRKAAQVQAAQDSVSTATLAGDDSNNSHNERERERELNHIPELHDDDQNLNNTATSHSPPAPPQTQSLGYEDVESAEYRALLMARMTGTEKKSPRESARVKERVATLGSLEEDLNVRRQAAALGGRVLRDRGSGGGLR